MRGRAGGELGTASLELVSVLPLVLFAALFGLQVLLGASSVTGAQNAARAGSRTIGVGGSTAEARSATVAALPSWLRSDAQVLTTGTRVRVRVEVPLVLPWVSSNAFTVTRDAELPGS